MRALMAFTAATTAFVSASGPAQACRLPAPLVLDDVRFADVVVVGRIRNYRIVRDEEFRRKMLDNPKISADMRRFYEGPDTLLSDYARFDVDVDRVLAGKAPSSVSVTWDNSTFGEPEKMATGPFLIALRRSDSRTPPLRGPSATILPSREPLVLTVLQAPCSTPFLFESTSEKADAVRLLLRAKLR